MTHSAVGCTCPVHSDGTAQTLEELNFARGIWSASVDGDSDKVKSLLATVSSDSKDSSGYTSLHYASRNGHLEVCDILISAGATVNMQTPGGVTPLHRACYSGHSKIAIQLLKNGANPEITDQDGMTSLHKACEAGHCDIITIMCNHVSDPLGSMNQSNNRGQTPLDLFKTSSCEGNRKAIEFIQKYSTNHDN